MPIHEGQQNANDAAPRTVHASVDPDSLVQALAKAGFTPHQQQQAPRTSKLDSYLQEIEIADPENGKNTSKGTKHLLGAFKEDLMHEIKDDTEKVIGARLMAQQNNTALKFIDDTLDTLCGADEDLKPFQEDMKSALVKKWQTDAELKSYRERYDRGDIDFAKLRELSKEQVNKYNKFRKAEGTERGAAGMTKQETGSGLGASSEQQAGSIHKFETLKNEKEKSLYNGALEIAQRRNLRGEEAHKYASEQIDKFRAPKQPKQRKESA